MFNVAIIDPPWPYQKASDSKKLTGYVTQEGKEQYDTLSIEEMAKLPIGSVVDNYIFMWTVGPFIREALQLFDAWGFIYRSQMCWSKSTGLGIGYWFRGDHELVLVGSKEKSPAIRTNERSIFCAPRMKHSQKPDKIHEIVEKHFEGPYLEIFGRRNRPRWVVLGNEAPDDGQDIRESLQKYIVKKEESENINIIKTKRETFIDDKGVERYSDNKRKVRTTKIKI